MTRLQVATQYLNDWLRLCRKYPTESNLNGIKWAVEWSEKYFNEAPETEDKTAYFQAVKDVKELLKVTDFQAL